MESDLRRWALLGVLIGLFATTGSLTTVQGAPERGPARSRAPLGIASFGTPAISRALLARAGATLWLGGSQITFATQNGFRRYFLPSLNVGKTLVAQGGCSGDGTSGGTLNAEWMDRTAALAVLSTASPGGWYVIGNEVEDSFSDCVAPTQAAYGAQLDAWIAALHAHDPQAHFVGPNFTAWDAAPNSVAYPWGPPQRWWAQFRDAYRAAHGGVNPPFDVLSIHDYPAADSRPTTAMVDHFAAQARADGYPAPVWITECALSFKQPASRPLSDTQQQMVTAFVNALRDDPIVGRVYYFTQTYPGHDNNGPGDSLRSVFGLQGSPTEVAGALALTVGTTPGRARRPAGAED